MSDTNITEEEKVTREVGERVDLLCNFDQASVKSLGDGVFEATVTTSEVDRHMESIDTEGISTDNYMKNPVVLYGHDYSSLPIGKAISVKSFKNKMTARFQLAVKELPFAATVAELIKGGYLNAVSIGGVVRQWSEDYMTIQEMDMVEFSVVPVPANPSAIITGKSLKEMTGKDSDEIAKEFAEALNQNLVDKVKDLDDTELKSYIKSLEGLLVILKANAETEPTSKSEREVIRLTLRKTAAEVSQNSQNIIKLVKKKES